MKLAQAEQHVVSSSGLEQQQAFKIRTSAHAFKILSSGLYSDKISAVLREIGCNAHDAHVSIGKSHIPFEVKIPNRIDNQFWIKDFGPGLSHDEVMNLYTTYFASTKQDSNDFTGAFGLGSKSPFSYTDSFTIRSCYGGEARVYVACIGNDGAPSISLMGDVSPTAETGITVSFPVKQDDFVAFMQKAQNIFQYFNPLPTIIGWEQIKPLVFKEDFGLFAITDNQDDYGRGAPIAVQMGNVRYPFSQVSLQAPTTTELDRAALQLKNVLLRFKIGELQAAASREELQYDPTTRKTILERLQQVVVHICRDLEKRWFTQCGSGRWDDKVDFAKLIKETNNSVTISEKLLVEAGITKAAEIYKLIYDSGEELPTAFPGSKYSILYQGYRGQISCRRAPYRQHYTPVNLVIGKETNAYSRVKKALKEGALKEDSIVITRDTKAKGTWGNVDITIDRLRQHFKGVPEIQLATLPPPVIIKSVRTKKGQLPALPADMLTAPAKTYVLKTNKSSWGRQRIKYFFDLTNETRDWTINTMGNHISTLKGVIKLEKPIELSPAESRKLKMDKRPDWVSYTKYIESILNDPKTIATLKAKIHGFKETVKYDHYLSGMERGLAQNLIWLAKEHPLIALSPILKEFGIEAEFEEIKKQNGSLDLKPEKLLEAYKGLASVLDLQITAPEYKTVKIQMDANFPTAARITHGIYKELAASDPEILCLFLKTVLRKDKP